LRIRWLQDERELDKAIAGRTAWTGPGKADDDDDDEDEKNWEMAPK
jgi:hypothetical protein